jgi:hypothetical protein
MTNSQLPRVFHRQSLEPGEKDEGFDDRHSPAVQHLPTSNAYSSTTSSSPMACAQPSFASSESTTTASGWPP